MAIQNKDYFTFLGGEVSPNLFKRVDMRAANKWFETAKNIFFDTTGGFFNRVGTEIIDNTNYFSSDRLKLLKFIYNKAQSYEVVFSSNYIRIFDNKTLLYSIPLTIQVPENFDIIYTQIGDVMYICLGSDFPIYTLTRYANDNWQFNKFNYNIPPMLSDNTVRAKRLDFTAETVTNSTYYFRLTLPTPTSAVQNYFSGASVTIYNSNTGLWEEVFNGGNAQYQTAAAFVTAFNSYQLGGHNFSCVQEGTSNNIRIYIDRTNHLDDATTYTQAKITVTDGIYSDTTTGNIHTPTFSFASYNYDNVWKEKTGSGSASWNSDAKFFKYYFQYGTGGSNSSTSQSNLSGVSLSSAISTMYNAMVSAGVGSYVSSTSTSITTSYRTRVRGRTDLVTVEREYYGCANARLTYRLKQTYTDTQNLTTISSSTVTPTVFDIVADFDFFDKKNVGDVFAITSVYTPSTNGTAGVNKTYYDANISTGRTVTDPFWSNGDWRIVTSGIWGGTIELQYSYDGDNWLSYKTYASSVREENSIKYANNYNEYGTLDVDDNVMLRLIINENSGDPKRFCVSFDTNSFENRSYYKILEFPLEISDSNNTLYVRKPSADGTGYYAWSDSTNTVYTNSATPSVDDYAYSNTALSTQAFQITLVQYSKTHAKVQSIKYAIGTPNETYEWSESAWSDTEGYPAICFTYQNRLCFAKTTGNPFTVWTSRTNDYEDFSTKVKYLDDDPITMDVVKFNGISNIATVAALNKLFVFTEDAEFGIQDQGALTQANKSLVSFSKYGAEPIETQVSGNRILFVENGGKAARQLYYDFAQDNYEAPDVTVLYKHLLKDEKIIATDYIGLDYRTYLMLTSSGRVICYKYIPEQEVTACSWFKHAKGTITNISVLDVGNNTVRIYMAVDIGARKQIEVMDLTNESYLDSRHTFTTVSQTDTIDVSGYYDNGDVLTYFLDGIKYTATVTNGNVTLEYQVSSGTSITFGYAYESEATLIPVSILARNGSMNYNKKNLFKANFEYFDSVGFKVGVKDYQDEFEEIQYLDGPIGSENTPHSGEKDDIIIESSYLGKNMLSFKQSEPYKMNITNLQIEVDYGG